jgi:hypothetical protein
MMKEPAVVVSHFQSFLSYIFSQAPQNATVKLELTAVLGGANSQVNNPLHIKKEHALLNFGPAAPFLFLVFVGSSSP